MKLKELLTGISVLECTADPELEIKEIYYDSRKVTPDSLFVAVSGFAADGNKFIPMAAEKGAAAVVTAKKPETDIPYVLVESDRLALALLGRNFFGRPAEQMTMIGITGTNGKTSSSLLLKQVLETCLGAKVGLIGTMANMIGQEIIPTERTTPESFELQALFARMRDAGCTHVVMEVSSHAISLERIGGIHFDVAAFTNLTEDHLDFHKTMDAYCEAKAELFRRCRLAVVNADDCYSDRILAAAACPVLTTGVHHPADLRGENLELLAQGIRFTAVSGEERAAMSLPIPGKFTVYNALTYFTFYIIILLIAGLIVSLDGLDFTTNFTAALSCLSNVGPGLSLVGPTGSFSIFSPLSKIVLMICMLLGRLEIFPLLLLFVPFTWRWK